MFTPNGANAMTAAVKLLNRSLTKVVGVERVTYNYADVEPIFLCNFTTYLGGEVVEKGLTASNSDAKVICSYRPDIKQGDRLELLDNNTLEAVSVWDITSIPDNIEQRDRYLQFKIKLVT